MNTAQLQDDIVFLAAAYLHIPNRRLRALVRNQERDLKEWLVGDSARNVAHARHRAREAMQRLERLHARMVSIGSPDYPPGLLKLEDPPALLFVRGTLPQSGIAVIGSRTPPPDALDFAHSLAAQCGEPIISGLARGIDAAAHRGAIESEIPTVAYVGTGLGITYPPEHQSLEEDIIAHGGAIATERLPEEPVTKSALAHRDRLQAAHASAVILICSEIDGGAMQTMRFAKELSRPRFVLDAKGSAAYAGNEKARADGAFPLPFAIDAAMKRMKAALR